MPKLAPAPNRGRLAEATREDLHTTCGQKTAHTICSNSEPGSRGPHRERGLDEVLDGGAELQGEAPEQGRQGIPRGIPRRGHRHCLHALPVLLDVDAACKFPISNARDLAG